MKFFSWQLALVKNAFGWEKFKATQFKSGEESVG